MGFHMSQSNSYSVVLTPEPEGGFTVRVPAFPEVVTYDIDEAEAMAMAREAIELSIEQRHATGEELPESDQTILRSISIPLPSEA